MAAVDIFDVKVLDNPAPFTNPLQFEITYDVREALKEDIEWKVIYVGSAEDETRDQELDAVLLPASNPGRFKFVLQVDAPKPSLIPSSDLVGVTIILLACSYKDAEFVRVGYYVSNEYPTAEMNENPPATPILDQIKRTIASNDPRVTKFPHKFDFIQPPPAAAGTTVDPELSTDGTSLLAAASASQSGHEQSPGSTANGIAAPVGAPPMATGTGSGLGIGIGGPSTNSLSGNVAVPSPATAAATAPPQSSAPATAGLV